MLWRWPTEARSLKCFGLRLTPRQMDVLFSLVKGKSNKEIARELNLAEPTIKLHVTALLKGLQVNNRTQAAVKAAQLGIVSLDSASLLNFRGTYLARRRPPLAGVHGALPTAPKAAAFNARCRIPAPIISPGSPAISESRNHTPRTPWPVFTTSRPFTFPCRSGGSTSGPASPRTSAATFSSK